MANLFVCNGNYRNVMTPYPSVYGSIVEGKGDNYYEQLFIILTVENPQQGNIPTQLKWNNVFSNAFK